MNLPRLIAYIKKFSFLSPEIEKWGIIMWNIH